MTAENLEFIKVSGGLAALAPVWLTALARWLFPKAHPAAVWKATLAVMLLTALAVFRMMGR